MKVMFDTNVLLDVFQNRRPHYRNSAFCVHEVLKGTLEGWIPAHAITTFYYLLERDVDEKTAREAVQWLLVSFQTAPCDHSLLTDACVSGISDFEDAVVALSAARVGCSHIVTRNGPDVSGSPVSALSPAELLERLN